MLDDLFPSTTVQISLYTGCQKWVTIQTFSEVTCKMPITVIILNAYCQYWLYV